MNLNNRLLTHTLWGIVRLEIIARMTNPALNPCLNMLNSNCATPYKIRRIAIQTNSTSDTSHLTFRLRSVLVAALQKVAAHHHRSMPSPSGWPEQCVAVVVRALSACSRHPVGRVKLLEGGWVTRHLALLSHPQVSRYYSHKRDCRAGGLVSWMTCQCVLERTHPARPCSRTPHPPTTSNPRAFIRALLGGLRSWHCSSCTETS